MSTPTTDGTEICELSILGHWSDACEVVLEPGALNFVAALEEKFGPIRAHLLEKRHEQKKRFQAGELPNFLDSTRHIRAAEWKVAPPPSELVDRRVEITGPVDRKMIINGLNSGANVFMADFEDSNSPTWDNCINGQLNLIEAVKGSIRLETSEKTYSLNPNPAVLFVRPRGLHLPEKHVKYGDHKVSASLFDYGLFLYHNAVSLLKNGTAPYFYLPKLENHLEARFWNEVFDYSEKALELPTGAIKATVLIETITAAFEMEEILWELRERSVGLNCGRWDYIFSVIKNFGHRPDFILPDRADITMERHFLKSYSEHLVQTCHRRGAHAMGGMAAQIPIKDDSVANAFAQDLVRADKIREVGAGHDGTWVAHPGLVSLTREVFEKGFDGPNQLHNRRDDVLVSANDLLQMPDGTFTEGGLRLNLSVCALYLAYWLSGKGCVPIRNLMEDAATAEISRMQVWQWLHHKVSLADGRIVTFQLVEKILDQEVENHRKHFSAEAEKRDFLGIARDLLLNMFAEKEPADFLTLKAYERII